MLTSLIWPACSRFTHSNSRDAFPSSHLGDEAFNLLFAAIVDNVGHNNVWVQTETRAWAVRVHSGGCKRNVITESSVLSHTTYCIFKFYEQLTAPPTWQLQKTRLLRHRRAPLVSLVPAGLAHQPSPTIPYLPDQPSPTWNKEKGIIFLTCICYIFLFLPVSVFVSLWLLCVSLWIS